jgi:hypothetical protein
MYQQAGAPAGEAGDAAASSESDDSEVIDAEFVDVEDKAS